MTENLTAFACKFVQFKRLAYVSDIDIYMGLQLQSFYYSVFIKIFVCGQFMLFTDFLFLLFIDVLL